MALPYCSELGKILNISPRCAPWFAYAEFQVWMSTATVNESGFGATQKNHKNKKKKAGKTWIQHQRNTQVFRRWINI